MKPFIFFVILMVLLLTACGASESTRVVHTSSQVIQQPAAYPFPSPTGPLGVYIATSQAEDIQQTHVRETEIAQPTSSTPFVYHPHPTFQPILQPTGYSYDCEGADKPHLERHSNCWYGGATGGAEVEVHAGASGITSGHGEIVVYDTDNNITGYTTPRATGAITITDVQSTFFTFEGADGSTVIFDVATRQWVDSVPALTPDGSVPTLLPETTPDAAVPMPDTDAVTPTPLANISQQSHIFLAGIGKPSP